MKISIGSMSRFDIGAGIEGLFRLLLLLDQWKLWAMHCRRFSTAAARESCLDQNSGGSHPPFDRLRADASRRWDIHRPHKVASRMHSAKGVATGPRPLPSKASDKKFV